MSLSKRLSANPRKGRSLYVLGFCWYRASQGTAPFALYLTTEQSSLYFQEETCSLGLGTGELSHSPWPMAEVSLHHCFVQFPGSHPWRWPVPFTNVWPAHTVLWPSLSSGASFYCPMKCEPRDRTLWVCIKVDCVIDVQRRAIWTCNLKNTDIFTVTTSRW